VVDRAVLLGALRRGRVHCGSVAPTRGADPGAAGAGGQLRQPDLPGGVASCPTRTAPTRSTARSARRTRSVTWTHGVPPALEAGAFPCNEQGSTSTRWWRGRVWVVQGRDEVSTRLRGVASMRPAKEVDGGSGMRPWAPAPTSSPRWGAASIPSAVVHRLQHHRHAARLAGLRRVHPVLESVGDHRGNGAAGRHRSGLQPRHLRRHHRRAWGSQARSWRLVVRPPPGLVR
jgi:hypothetical protein